MIRKVLTADLEHLQSRPAAQLVQEACKYISRILIEQGDKTVNVKSMMGVLSLVSPSVGEVALIIEGDDERQALDALMPLIREMLTKVP
ncbi:MAG: HPr family phosphocarrier protein [Clostridia bacterium]|nr:HPr family phosphocarrier protein [Clostridia bacterium]